MKIVVTDTRGILDVMGGVETRCEELFPRIVRRGVRLVDIECPKKKSFEAIVHTFKAINEARRLNPMSCISMLSVPL